MRTFLSLLLCSSLLTACGDDASTTPADAATDTASDVAPDVTADVLPDAAVDAPRDAASDTADAAVDAPRDAASDTSDAAVDGARDASTDSANDAGCAPLAANGDAVGTRCTSGGSECPSGYVCDALNGIVVTYSCQIRCARDCECPSGLACRPFGDKAGMRMLCQR